MMKVCPNCSYENDSSAKFCKKCGTNLDTESGERAEPSASADQCPSCGYQNDSSARFCKKCGTKLSSDDAKAKEERKRKAADAAKQKAKEEERKRKAADAAKRKAEEEERKRKAAAEVEAEAEKLKKKKGETVTCAVLDYPQIEATKIVSKMLEGSLFKKAEEIARAKLKYLPLWKVACKVKKGGFFSKKVEEIDNLYYNALNGKLYHLGKDKIVFDNIVRKKIGKISDLDDEAKFEQKLKNDLPKSALKTRTKVKTIRQRVENMFGVKAESVETVLLPIWEFKIKHLEKRASRTVYLDGVFGREYLDNPFKRS